jgi:glycerate kinase
MDDMRVLVAPQEFKGTLTAQEAADAIARGLQSALPDLQIETLPLADGGPGTVGVLVDATKGSYVESDVHDPLGRPLLHARWGLLGRKRAGTAAIEMAAASGLVLLTPRERDPRVTTTYGTGELILEALNRGCSEIVVGVGGSATNDGGAGMAQALGARLLDGDGNDLPFGGAALARLARIDAAPLDDRVTTRSFVVAVDVRNPLCGPEGASVVYGPQKGASPELALDLDRALAHYAEIVARDLGVDVANVPGSGAAGGLAAGLIAFCRAIVRSGFDVVAGTVDLERHIAGKDVVVTGEGRIDSQTPFGKTSAGVAAACRRHGINVIAVAGQIADPAQASLFDATFDVSTIAQSPEAAMRDARELLERLAFENVSTWLRESR